MTHVYVIEDDASVRLLWAEVLKLKNYTVSCFANASDALERIRDEFPDLVLLDLTLPDMRGAEVVSELRRDHGPADLPIVVVSGSDREEDMHEVFDAGISDYLVKPVRPQQLLTKVSLQLRQSEELQRAVFGADYLPGEVACGKYLVEEVLGRGSYGVVYGAWTLDGDQAVALKLLVDPSPVDRDRFLRECYTLGAIDHPGVVRVVEFGQWDDDPYLVMERVEGVSLSAWLRSVEVATEEEVAAILHGLCGALAALARGGVVHRDIKPANVMLRNGNPWQPVLIDFGLAKRPFEAGLTSPDMMLGTPGYMPPEVLGGDRLDHRGDLFALGMTARYLLTGHEAYPELSGLSLLQRMARSPVSFPAGLNPELHGILTQLTALDPEERPQFAGEIQDRLGELLGAEGAPRGELGYDASVTPTLALERPGWEAVVS